MGTIATLPLVTASLILGLLYMGSCTPALRIIPSTQKPGNMPHLNPFWRGHCHGLAFCLLSTRSVGDHLALCHVVSHWVQTRSDRPPWAGPAQAQAVHRAQSVRGLDAQAALCPVLVRDRTSPSPAADATGPSAVHEPTPP